MTVARAKARRPAGAVMALIGAMIVALAGPATGAPTAGSAGTDTSLPATASQVTVSGRARFANLKVKVNQTKNLVNQAVSVSWSGGLRTNPAEGGIFGGNYLQLMQCWGEDDGTDKANPGPPPEQCVQGATRAIYGYESTLFSGRSQATERIVTKRDWPNFDPSLGVLDERGRVWKPFRSVDGSVIGIHESPTFAPSAGGDYWLNPYFNVITTNEIAAGRTRPNGEGAELFEVETGLESSGLGCGQRVQLVVGGPSRVPKCWLVIVPRGAPVEENVGTPEEAPVAANAAGVITSPLAPRAWVNRIAVPLEFNPVDSPCTLSGDERRIVGSALASSAVSSWQPSLCATAGRLPYSYATINESVARQQLTSGRGGSAGMIAVSRPLERSAVDPDRRVIYAPISASAAVVGFNVEREGKLADGKSNDEAPLEGARVAEINLTPRLLAKLLTQSYYNQVAIVSKAPSGDWVKKNPLDLGLDPDFLEFNPEFNLLAIRNTKNFGGLVLPAGNSDTARQVWEYVLADPEAKAWLDGVPDSWGMRVNPAYATTGGANSSGVPFAAPLPDSYPKSDPTCFQGPPLGSRGQVVPPIICGTDWLPYAPSLRDAARRTRAADDGTRLILNPNAQKPDEVYGRTPPSSRREPCSP